MIFAQTGAALSPGPAWIRRLGSPCGQKKGDNTIRVHVFYFPSSKWWLRIIILMITTEKCTNMQIPSCLLNFWFWSSRFFSLIIKMIIRHHQNDDAEKKAQEGDRDGATARRWMGPQIGLAEMKETTMFYPHHQTKRVRVRIRFSPSMVPWTRMDPRTHMNNTTIPCCVRLERVCREAT